MIIHGKEVLGALVDNQTRCKHYHKEVDIIAIKFKCCDTYYPCIKCHEEETKHNVQVWPQREFHTEAILCGNCGIELTIGDYLNSSSTCPNCKHSFNEGCANHHHLYFDISQKKEAR
ncbi:CHY zinc finger protein [Aquibacillus kalidii]|uniref:CHY zinc finger protein n=1 Tax=Aquibacillus kalidii TaxID=2762597 RepID=UPI0016440918|nr:CHY zinc finger protein [Aquibacillus kalidii]